MRVKDAMTLGLIGVPETATLSEALDALLRGRISALFVFDASGEPGYLVPPADTPGFDGARRGWARWTSRPQFSTDGGDVPPGVR